VVIVVAAVVLLAGGLGTVAWVLHRANLNRAKAIERGLKMVPVLIHLPPASSDTAGGGRDVRDVMREKVSQAAVLYNLIAGTAKAGFASQFFGQRHMALELIATNGMVNFYAAIPVALVSTVVKAIQTAYPGARMEEVEEHNIFNKDGRISGTLGGELILKDDAAYPIATYAQLDRDPMEAILTTLTGLGKEDGAAIQIMIRPASASWARRSAKLVTKLRRGGGKTKGLGITPGDFLRAAFKAPSAPGQMAEGAGGMPQLSNLDQSRIEAIEEKTKLPAFETLIRVVVSASSVDKSQQLLQDIATGFSLFERPGLNGFKFLPAADTQGLVTAFVLRFFPPVSNSSILNSAELATLFHLPDAQFTPMTNVQRQQSKQVDGPAMLPSEGTILGYNEFRGVRKEIRLAKEDRRRHMYILGQTGVGKSTMLENLAVQDMLAGNGFCFIDPHGDTAEKLMSMIPKNRAEDVIYFNPGDTDNPLGLNLFEFTDPGQKDFIIQETINMLYKLYDPGHTGIIGPRYEHWYRNAALTLMADPNGSTFIEIPKVFTDTEYLKKKFRYLKDPTVIDFWTNEMAQTSDYHKSEMLGWFVSKFGAFQNNEMMRNIIGQTKSAFNLRDVMDNKKILIVNLSKGRVGELNSKLLGMIFVIKIQAAAMSRVDTPEEQRPDFSLYVDEFQNFSTDSFASILSEARKFHLNLIVANQFIGQLTPEIRDAVFGNIGTIAAYRMGPEDAEFMVKQFAPVFDASDLVNLPNYNTAMRLMIGGLPSLPFTMACLPPLGSANAELGAAIKQLSAAKFGRSKASVEADIAARLTGQPAGAPAAPVTVPAAVGPAAPAAAPSAAPAPMPAPASASTQPPPISQPGVQPITKPAPASPNATASLSIADITGGRPTLPAQPLPTVIPAPVPSPVPTPTPAPVRVEISAPVTPPAPTIPTAAEPKLAGESLAHVQLFKEAAPVKPVEPVLQAPVPAPISAPIQLAPLPSVTLPVKAAEHSVASDEKKVVQVPAKAEAWGPKVEFRPQERAVATHPEYANEKPATQIHHGAGEPIPRPMPVVRPAEKFEMRANKVMPMPPPVAQPTHQPPQGMPKFAPRNLMPVTRPAAETIARAAAQEAAPPPAKPGGVVMPTARAPIAPPAAPVASQPPVRSTATPVVAPIPTAPKPALPKAPEVLEPPVPKQAAPEPHRAPEASAPITVAPSAGQPGGVIMPSAAAPQANLPKEGSGAQAPLKLAKGEVYVDNEGRVYLGQ
jgi:hypothetical protein